MGHDSYGYMLCRINVCSGLPFYFLEGGSPGSKRKMEMEMPEEVLGHWVKEKEGRIEVET